MINAGVENQVNDNITLLSGSELTYVVGQGCCTHPNAARFRPMAVSMIIGGSVLGMLGGSAGLKIVGGSLMIVGAIWWYRLPSPGKNGYEGI